MPTRIANRERLLAAATDAFAAADGTAVSLEGIAREAGVGIGTLYRHFATREALVEAVYRTELAEVATAAEHLLERHPPLVALRQAGWTATRAFVADQAGHGRVAARDVRRGHREAGRLPATASSAPSKPF